MNEIEIFTIIVTIAITVLAISVICLIINLRRLKEKFDNALNYEEFVPEYENLEDWAIKTTGSCPYDPFNTKKEEKE